jgi:hypothetical protein
VEHVALPVLQGDVAQVRALADVELDGPVGEGRVLGARARVLVYVRDGGALLDHDEGARHDRADHVQPPVALDRHLHVDPPRHVKEDPPAKPAAHNAANLS